MDDAAKAIRDSIAEKVETINAGGGSTFYEAVKKVADEAAATVVSVGKNSKGKTIWKVGPAKNKGGPITKPKAKMMGGGMYGGGEYKKPQMVHGGVHKGKKHAYAAGGMVKDMNTMRNK